MMFDDRQDAGRQLAQRLVSLKGEQDLIVIGIPRGGVVVAAEIARVLEAPLDVIIAHKIGAPGNPEFAIGAVTSAGEIWTDDATIKELEIDWAEIALEVSNQREELNRRAGLYRGSRAPLDVKNRVVVLADDGIATGATMIAAIRALRKHEPARLILAIPVGPPETVAQLRGECDEVVALATPVPFWAVGRFYARFGQTEDAEVVELLRTT